MGIFMNTRGSAEHYHETAYFGWQNKVQSLWGIKEGYKTAADQLVDYVLKMDNEGIREKFIFPILFCYRHSVEIALKLLYLRGTGELCKGGHDLLTIWAGVKRDIIEGILNNDEKVQEAFERGCNLIAYNPNDIPVNSVQKMLKELLGADLQGNEQIEYIQGDRQADIWRYLISPAGKLYFQQGHWVHYPNIKEVMNELFSILDYLDDVVASFGIS